jgi:hypothetical protein
VVSLADYTVVDDLGRRAAVFFEAMPYWVLIAIAVALFVLFLYGLAKRLVVFTVLIAVLAVAIGGVWFMAGHLVTV